MSYTEGTWASTGCTDQITVTFTATDECGLTTSTTFTFTITDTTPPALYGGANGTAECTGSDPNLNAAYIAWRNSFGGVTTTDICGERYHELHRRNLGFNAAVPTRSPLPSPLPTNAA